MLCMDLTDALISATRRMLLLACALPLGGCFATIDSAGGGEIKGPVTRRINAADIGLPSGYEIRPIARELTYPTGVAFDDKGALYVVESGYSYGEDFVGSRLMRVGRDGYE